MATEQEEITTAVDPQQMECVYEKPDTLTDAHFHYCPGCGHSVVHRVLMEVIDEMGIPEQTIGVAPVGCSVFAYSLHEHRHAGGRARTGQRGGDRHEARSPGQVRLLLPGRRRSCRDRHGRDDPYGATAGRTSSWCSSTMRSTG